MSITEIIMLTISNIPKIKLDLTLKLYMHLLYFELV